MTDANPKVVVAVVSGMFGGVFRMLQHLGIAAVAG